MTNHEIAQPVTKPLAVSLSHGGPNQTKVQLGDLLLAFSYSTVIGFSTPTTGGWVVSENVWSPTTSKHLNALGEQGQPEKRIERGVWLDMLNSNLTRRGLAVFPS